MVQQIERHTFVNALVLLIVVVAVATATQGTEAMWLLATQLGLVCTATMRDIWVFTFPFPFLFHFSFILGITIREL